MAVSEACQPSLCSAEDSTPSPRSTIRKEMPWWPPSCGRLDGRDDEVRAHAVGDVGLLAVDHPAAVDALGARAQRRDVRAGARLGDAERADQLAADRRHEVALLLLVGAELPDRRRGDVDVRADARRRAARADARELLARAPPRAGSRRPGRRTRSGTSARAGPARPSWRTPRRGTSASSSHCCAWGVSSRSMKPRTDARSSSCSSANGGFSVN